MMKEKAFHVLIFISGNWGTLILRTSPHNAYIMHGCWQNLQVPKKRSTRKEICWNLANNCNKNCSYKCSEYTCTHYNGRLFRPLGIIYSM